MESASMEPLAVKHSSDLAYIRQLCCLGLGAQAIMPALLNALHKVLPSYVNVFQYTDENCEITNGYAESPIPADIIQLYYSEFHNKSEVEVMPSFPETLRRGARVGHLRGVCTREYYRSDVYNLIHRPCGLHYALDGIVRDAGRPLGAVLLYRGPGDPPFTKSNEQLLASLIPYIAYAFSAKPDFTGTFVDSGEHGMIILNQQGETLFMCPQGRRLLFLSTHPQVALQTVYRRDDHAIPPALRRLVNNLRKIFTSQDAAPPVVYHHNPWGRFAFRAYWLEQNDYSSNALIGVTVRRQEPLPLKLMRTMQKLSLSATQREVCLLLAEGLTHDAIARRMDVGLSTATDHVRKIYDKLDVHSHEQLIHRLLAGPDDSA